MIKGSLLPLIKRLEKKFKRFDGELLLKIGLGINSIIDERTQSGKGSRGEKMRLYSPSYAKLRETGRLNRKTGRIEGGGRDITKRTLNFSSKMWTSLTATRTSKNQVTLHFAGADEIKKAVWNDKKTPFFRLGKSGHNYLRKELSKFNKEK